MARICLLIVTFLLLPANLKYSISPHISTLAYMFRKHFWWAYRGGGGGGLFAGGGGGLCMEH